MSPKLVPLSAYEKRRKAEASQKADLYIGKDGGPPHIERALNELGEMSPAEYGRRREEIADTTATPRTFLDMEYRERRRRAKADDVVEFLSDPEPWPEPVNGVALLDEIRDAAARHIVLPEGGAEIMALWTVFAHCHDGFDVSPLLALTSPTPECGKSTGLAFLGCLTPRALNASNVTAAAMFRAVEKWRPTLLIDEADTFIGDRDELRGILNSGHHRANAFVIRTTGDNHEPTRFCTWGPKVWAMIGKLPPTLASRAIHIQLRRMLPSDRIEPLRIGKTRHLDPLKQKAARWAADYANDLRAADDPQMPEALYGRAADNWRPLIGIADLAGGDWPAQVRHIALKVGGRYDDLAPVMVLHDIQALFVERDVHRLPSAEITEALAEMEDRPWPEWKNGKPITPRQLAKLLDGFGVVPVTVRDGMKTPKGYHRSPFDELVKRYPSSQSATTPQALDTNEFDDFQSATSEDRVADLQGEKLQESNCCGGVADEMPSQGDFECEHDDEDARVAWEEAAARYEYDAGLSREEAEAQAVEEFDGWRDMPDACRRWKP